MANFLLDFEVDPRSINGARCEVATGVGVAMPTGYRGAVGGSVLLEWDRRRRKDLAAQSAVIFPAGFSLCGLGGELPTGAFIVVDSVYNVIVIDPSGSESAPVPTLVALVGEISP